MMARTFGLLAPLRQPGPNLSDLSLLKSGSITIHMFAHSGSGSNAGRGVPGRIGVALVRRSTSAPRRAAGLLAPLILSALATALTILTPACAELELLAEGSGGGPGPPPSGSLSVSFIDVGQGDGVLVQAGGESYLIDAGRPEEGPNVVDFLRSRGVESLDGIVVTNPRS